METILQVENLAKAYGDWELFEGLTMSIGEGEKVGLIGRNGAGKSSLLDILAGGDSPDSGTITFRRDTRVAYLVQTPRYPDGTTILEACFTGDTPLMRVVAGYEAAVESGDAAQIERAMVEMDAHSAWDYEAKAKEILTRLRITDFDRVVDNLSGGELKRIALANALLGEPNLLILDEPTNHLDMDVTLWLERYLAQSNLALLMVTHDRYFLDRVCSRIIELADRRVYSYDGNYAYYIEKRGERAEALAAERESDLNRYRRELEWMRRQPQARATKAQYRIDSFHELEEKLRTRRAQATLELDIKSSYIGKKIFELRGLSKRFGEKVIMRDFSYTFQRYDKIGIVGNNGTGKSTFIRMLLGEVAPDSGTIDVGTTVRFGYYSQQGITFDENTKVIDVVSAIAEHIDLGDGRRLSASQMLQMFLFEPPVQHNFVSRLSGGERRRLYLCTILMRNPNFLILDEPTNDLDIATLQVLEEYLQRFTGCVMVVSHDRYFMDKVTDHLLVFEGDGAIKDFPGTYSDFLEWRTLRDAELKRAAAQTAPKSEPAPKRSATPRADKLSYKEKREMESIEAELPKLEERKASLEAELSSGTLAADKLTALSVELGELIEHIDTISMRWLELCEKA